MFGGVDQTGPGRSAALIGGLTLFALAAMATAIPPARLTPKTTGVERGYVVSGASFSDMLAEMLNSERRCPKSGSSSSRDVSTDAFGP